jgi:hypothetical protein
LVYLRSPQVFPTFSGEDLPVESDEFFIMAFGVGLSFAFSIRWLPQFILSYCFSSSWILNGFQTHWNGGLHCLILFNFKRGEATDWTIGV